MARKEISDFEIYQIAMLVGDKIYSLVNKWDSLNKYTIGKQVLRAVDSIAANISEGYGRFHFKEQRQFFFFARGSLYESKTWLLKAIKRQPNDRNSINEILDLLDTLHIKLNAYIKYMSNRIS